MNPHYPIYIVSKGRWKSRLTSRALELLGVPYHIVVEPQERDAYASVIKPEKILTLPFSNLGLGSIPARNWIWDHAQASGAERHWIMDDNIRCFYRLNRNLKVEVASGTILRVIEMFVDRYTNVAIAGPHYAMFAARKAKLPAFIMNTRVYSCILIKNDLPYRWRGRYNEDTDLSIRALKDGWVTFLFFAFLADKMATMTMSGGNTEQLYQGDGRLKMAQALCDLHPDVSKIIWRWGRWQHLVDYRPFRGNKPIKKPGLVVPPGVNEYGMVMLEDDQSWRKLRRQ